MLVPACWDIALDPSPASCAEDLQWGLPWYYLKKSDRNSQINLSCKAGSGSEPGLTHTGVVVVQHSNSYFQRPGS